MEKVKNIYTSWEWECPACKAVPFQTEYTRKSILKCNSCGAEFEADWGRDRIVIEVSDNQVSAVWVSHPESELEIFDWDTKDFDPKIKALANDDEEYHNKINGLYLLEEKSDK